jgi:hypothetical protein
MVRMTMANSAFAEVRPHPVGYATLRGRRSIRPGAGLVHVEVGLGRGPARWLPVGATVMAHFRMHICGPARALPR